MKRVLVAILAVVALLAVMSGSTSAQEEPFSTETVNVGFPGPGSSPEQPQILSVDVGEHTGFDRIVLTFSGPLPSYRVGYGLTRFPNGLLIGLSPVAASNAGTPAPAANVPPGLAQVSGITRVEDFEGLVLYGVSVASVSGFRVFTLTDPDRIVVDLRIPSIVRAPSLAVTGGRSPLPTVAIGFGLLLAGVVVCRLTPRWQRREL